MAFHIAISYNIYRVRTYILIKSLWGSNVEIVIFLRLPHSSRAVAYHEQLHVLPRTSARTKDIPRLNRTGRLQRGMPRDHCISLDSKGFCRQNTFFVRKTCKFRQKFWILPMEYDYKRSFIATFPPNFHVI